MVECVLLVFQNSFETFCRCSWFLCLILFALKAVIVWKRHKCNEKKKLSNAFGIAWNSVVLVRTNTWCWSYKRVCSTRGSKSSSVNCIFSKSIFVERRSCKFALLYSGEQKPKHIHTPNSRNCTPTSIVAVSNEMCTTITTK